MKIRFLGQMVTGLLVAGPLGFAWNGHAAAQTVAAQSFQTGDYELGNFQTNVFAGGDFDRGQNVAVLDRPRPDYEAMGIHAGGFMVYPSMAVAATYDDNIYALPSSFAIPTGLNGPRGDMIYALTPQVNFKSTWSRDSLAGYARLTQEEYGQHSNEDATQYGAGLNGDVDLGTNTSITGGIDYGHYVAPRAAATSEITVKRVEFDFTAINAQIAHEFNRIRLSARYDHQDFDYQNAESTTGTVVQETIFNHTVDAGTGKAEFAISPDTALFIEAVFNQRTYTDSPLFDQNSHGYDIGGGANFDISHLIRGEINIGYLEQTYNAAFGNIKGLSTSTKVQWFPSELTTATLTVLRTVNDSLIIGSPGYLATDATVQVDHELLRNVILSGNLLTGEDQYQGISRTDSRFGGGLTANWLLNRHVGLTAGYAYTDVNSTGANRGSSFKDNRVTVSTKLQF
jgi:hypothetical protein